MKRFIFLSLSLFFAVFIILLIPQATTIKPFLPFANYLLGVANPTSYLVLLGNDTEMRANGGFAGSYAKLSLSTKLTNNFALITNNSLDFQDIYVPNGQLAGHVTPPEPIQQAFGHGTWELANADWEPDFPTAAQNIRWFLDKGKEINPDILAIINLTTIKQVLNIVGSFPVPEYAANITPENLYLFLQGKTETNFFPGSTQKKDTLTAVGQALIKKSKSLSLSKKLTIAHILYTDLINQNIMIHSSNTSFQAFLEQKKLAGVLSPEAFDTYSLIETNLGANKANQFVSRSTTHTITHSSSSTIRHQVTAHFTNSSPSANPNPPVHYGGNYIAYLRFYIPTYAQNISLTRTPEGKPPLPEELDTTTSTVNAKSASDAAIYTNGTTGPKCEMSNVKCKISYGLTEMGFWHTTPAGGESTISLAYDLLLPQSIEYSLAILKQHGLATSPQTVDLFGNHYSSGLRHSFRLP